MKLTFFAIFCALQALSEVENFTLECEFKRGSKVFVGDVYECWTENIPDSSNDTTIAAVTGTHLEGKNNSDVEGIYIDGFNRLSFFPRGASHFFPNLRTVYVARMAFEALHGDELNGFPALEWFGITNSRLVNISSTLFQSTPKIIVAYFSDNQIQRVGHDLFEPLNVSQLKFVHFGGNKCIDGGKTDGNTEAMKTFIENIRVRCPFDDEVRSTTTTSVPPWCYDGPIDDFVCGIDEKTERLERELGITRTELGITKENLQQTQTELGITRELLQEKSNKIGEIESEMREQEQKFAVMREQLDETMESLRALKELLA